MSERQINPVLKQVLELGPTIVFFLIYLRLRDETFQIAGTDYSGFIVATVIFVPILLVAMGILWAMTGKLSRMQVFTAFMVVFFGGLTAWFNDERFFKMKTSIVYGAFAAILGLGLLQGRSYMQWVMGEMLPMEDAGWMILTRRLTAMFAGLAIANEVIWRTQSTDLWVKLETFAFPAVLFAFLWLQIVSLQRYLLIEDDEGASEK
ncbi:septation protein IspZ [Ponticoccus sp. SC2-23]|uniref:inner membrane-spanning protein YciB n=1 Tax=Alexandriicola marinus TaxID=2081710 RepID=UPI000FDCCEAF|nr:inner membrane-spanning protein YciB [Alexandriicola marinus]MBM1221056.1 septation protein IspZ [Ponticoccus sp. SC6-9]MBM1225626.1 septation protein IspZ [Ponticoccus sp. SC6-15]MBM1227778.1 septation protein IspZ [Ponticoccus sp. SC6-38]MBM1234584.1 septation protein IspZ [Ponticoccus sp. SC6-45]MBM1238280.1 septation protein IspZ [Ponticoccus sp. SC6-49]MBM1243549.1 septation protein IspZ [Ponticoccus sp. SC2-64]MBM1248108.1 septation protein IspZ [Ponticoccus sp. SC6-42]MBM1252680.1